jgi:hypothetical protein
VEFGPLGVRYLAKLFVNPSGRARLYFSLTRVAKSTVRNSVDPGSAIALEGHCKRSLKFAGKPNLSMSAALNRDGAHGIAQAAVQPMLLQRYGRNMNPLLAPPHCSPHEFLMIQ